MMSKYEMVSAVEAITRTVRYNQDNEYRATHHDDLTEALIPIYGHEEFNESIRYLLDRKVIILAGHQYSLS